MWQAGSDLTGLFKKAAANVVKVRYELGVGSPEEKRILAGKLLEGDLYLNQVRLADIICIYLHRY